MAPQVSSQFAIFGRFPGLLGMAKARGIEARSIVQRAQQVNVIPATHSPSLPPCRHLSPITIGVNISILGLSLYGSGWPGMGTCIQLGLPVLVLIIAFAFHMRNVKIFGWVHVGGWLGGWVAGWGGRAGLDCVAQVSGGSTRVSQALPLRLPAGWRCLACSRCCWAWASPGCMRLSSLYLGSTTAPLLRHRWAGGRLAVQCMPTHRTLPPTHSLPAPLLPPLQKACTTSQSNFNYIISTAPWVRVPYPGQWGSPIFSASGVLTLVAAVIPASLESIGGWVGGWAGRLLVTALAPSRAVHMVAGELNCSGSQ